MESILKNLSKTYNKTYNIYDKTYNSYLKDKIDYLIFYNNTNIMFYNLPNDILYNICYNTYYNKSNNIKEEKTLIEEKIKLSNLLLVNKALFNFIIVKYDKLVLCNFQYNYNTMKNKYNKFYEVNIYEDLSIINVDKFKNAKKISLRSCYNITNITSLQNIKYIDLSNCFELEDVSMLGNCKKLELCNCHKIKNVSNLGKVSYLDLSHCDKIEDISNLGNQKYLNLKGTNICNISNLSNVEVLDISYNYNIYDISPLKNVKTLDISFCSNILLNTNMNNHTFIAEYTNLIDDDIIYLKNIVNLHIRKNYYISDLSPLIKTKYLDIRQCKNIRVLPLYTNLDTIELSRDNYYSNLIQLGIDTLDIKNINIDNYY